MLAWRAVLLTAMDAARLLKTTERQIYRWADDGEIPCRRVRDQLRFNRLELLEWATSRRLPVSVEDFDSSDDDNGAPSLARALELGGVHVDVPGDDRDAALRAVVERVPMPPSVDRELLVEVLLAREHTGTTAIGHGIAIPHVRNPVVAAGAPACVTVCYLAHPVDFGATDHQPVEVLFMLVTPTIDAHLQLIARLSAALHDPQFRAAIDRRATAAELCREASRLDATGTPR